MKYEDKVYGTAEISEPAVLELIKAPSLQRLKGVDQIGYFEPHFPGTAHTRFEHSVGVFILLRKYNAPFEEQIAGLIHDASHPVFSHCIDYALDAGSEKEHSYQDNIFESFVKNSEIPSILEKYNLDAEYILREDDFPLKERALPDLCADRIDYSLRTAIAIGELNRKGVDYFLNNLITKDNRWVFKNFESAEKYAELFLKLNSVYYAGLPSALMFRTVGDCIRYALQKNYIAKDDLHTTDKQVLQKIKDNLDKDGKLQLLFARMENKIEFQNNPDDYDSRVFCKSRVVNPLCLDNDGMKRVSDINENWREVLKKELVPKEYFIKFKE